MNTHSCLQVKNIYKSFDNLSVLEGISQTFNQGTTYAITGASGSGKSTLLHILGGLDVPNKGSVFFNKQDIQSLKPKEKEKLLNQSIGFVFQFHYLIHELTIIENIMLMGMIKGEEKSTCKKKSQELLEHINLQTKANNYPWQLSGGEQQRISILRALFNKPAFLLADEPTGNLDAENAKQITSFLLQCQKEWNMSIILCSHDQNVYKQMEHIYHLENGHLK